MPKNILSIVIPCYNEEKTLQACVEKVINIADENCGLEIIIVDDGSQDNSYQIAKDLEKKYSEVKAIANEKNCGKGAALRNGF
jgi:glycosyltransferase involved in cell wall biosynthesis